MKTIDLIGTNLKRDDIIPYLVEITLNDPVDQSFARVKETLSRMGVAVMKEENTLYQSCHILSKRGKFYIVHFKIMFLLDGRENDLTEGDIYRQNLTIDLLSKWNLINIVDPSQIEGTIARKGGITVVPYLAREKWKFVKKYAIGNNRK